MVENGKWSTNSRSYYGAKHNSLLSRLNFANLCSSSACERAKSIVCSQVRDDGFIKLNCGFHSYKFM